MNETYLSKGKSKWGNSSVHLGNLHAAPSDDHFALHLAAIEYELSAPITIETREDILSRKHWSERLEPFEHQVKNLITFCRRAPVALFADDVGLGKTISAGLVLNELQTRKKVRRALVLCPKMLLEQWKQELREKFGIEAAAGVGQDLNTWLRQTVPVVITTYESARDRMDQIHAASFDMLILDEAHKLRNLHGSQSPPQIAKSLHQALANRNFPYVLMLTATPIQNRLWDMYSLVECLATAKGHANPLGNPEEFVQRYVADGGTAARRLNPKTRAEFRRKVQEYMVRTSRREAHLAFPERRVLPVQCHASTEEKKLQDLVGTALPRLNALARTSLAEALMSSPRALLAQVRNMTKTGTLPVFVLSEIENAVTAAGKGCKLAKLLDVLEALRAQNPQLWRAIIFTRRTETLELIREGLESRGIETVTIHGSGAASNQRSIRTFHADPPGAHALVSTDAGAVGLNLQVCNVIINYDLPWNPMVLEQRIGRVQRLGSKFKYVEVLNLTVAESIEDIIVSRLLSKLQAIAATLGDIEAILEASSFEDDEKFVEELKQLVTRALMGQDVSAALKQADESIKKAKAIYDAEREQVESTLGSLDEMHRAGPKVPKLKAKAPRFDAQTFSRKAFAADGAEVRDIANGQVRVAPKGHAPWVATFDERDPDLLRAGLGTFGGSNVRLYQEGSRPFEGLLGEWRRRHSHRVLDRVPESRGLVDAVLTNWLEGLGAPLRLSHWSIRREHLYFRGALEIRATASISHDRFEKLCPATHHHSEHGTLPPPSAELQPVSDLPLPEVLPQARQLVVDAVENDSDIREFIRFYDERCLEEVTKSGGSAAQRQEVARRYETLLSADLVGAHGYRYCSLEILAVFTTDAGQYLYESVLHLLPLNGKFLAEPERAPCSLTGSRVPKDWLAECAISKQRVLRHLLEKSALSGIAALPQHFGTCEVSGRRVLVHELEQCKASGKVVAVDLLRRSDLSGKRALAEELQQCEFTRAYALPSELVKSEVSGRLARADQILASAVSGTQGHRSEFRDCQETHAPILPSEGAQSDVSGRFVRLNLLVASQKNPTRRALASETVQCAVSSKRLLKDEAERSAVSKLWLDKDMAVRSAVSGKPALPDEMIKCEVSDVYLLPSEAGTSAVSGKTVDARLLVASALSGKLALRDELKTCDFTGAILLSTEGIDSEVSGRFVRIDQVVASAISKVQGHQSEFIRCQVSNDWLLPSEAETSDVSGIKVRPDLLKPSAKNPGRRGIESEFVDCSATARSLLRDEVGKSDASGRVVDSDLLMPSACSGRLAMQEELVTCEDSGARLLPDEVFVCAITGKRVDLRLLMKSEVSGRMAVKRETGRCDFTGVIALVDELARSDVSGKSCRVDRMEASALSGLRGHPSELVTCAISGQRLLQTEVATSCLSGRIARKDLLVASQRNPERLGFPDETAICSASSRRLLQDESVKSDLSGRWVDRDVAIRSSASNRVGLPGEAISCEESGATLFPDETEVCSVTGRRVDRRLLGVSDISGKRGLSRLLEVCPETGHRGFADELVGCSVSGLKVGPSQVAECTVTGKPALLRLMVRCAVTDRWLRRDKAVSSQKSGRSAHPDSARTCTWTGRCILIDEVLQCPITGLDFDRELIDGSSPPAPLLDLLYSGIPAGLPEEAVAHALRTALHSSGIRIRGLSFRQSEHRRVVAYFVDCSTMFGIKKRHGVGFADIEGDCRLLQPPSWGKLDGNSWVPESVR